jgi:hypothetical protein
MLRTNPARVAPAANGRHPQEINRADNTIGIGNSRTQQDSATVNASLDRNWWRAEARRIGSDWPNVLALHAAVVAALRKRHDPGYRGTA